MTTRPLGPSRRTYINAAALIETTLAPDALLTHLKEIEAKFGRRRLGQRWRARTLDLDIILWSGGVWATKDLQIPHPLFRRRSFVLTPICAVTRKWRDPVSGLSVSQLKVRLDRAHRAA